jgi:hypothetical protein
MKGMSRENALVELVKYQLRPLATRDQISRHYRLFNWEAVRPTTVYRDLISEEAMPFLGFSVDLMRRFMPNADQRTLTMAAIWLAGQCTIFVRNREQFANPPVSLNLDEAAVELRCTESRNWPITTDVALESDVGFRCTADIMLSGAPSAPVANDPNTTSRCSLSLRCDLLDARGSRLVSARHVFVKVHWLKPRPLTNTSPVENA